MNAFIPLKVANDAEQSKSWEGISTPHDLALYLARVMSLDAEKILALKEIYIGQEPPTGDDLGKIWLGNVDPVFLGIYSGGGYRKIYQYPINVPFLWIGSMPDYFRALTVEELDEYGLKDPAKPSVRWVIFEVQ